MKHKAWGELLDVQAAMQEKEEEKERSHNRRNNIIQTAFMCAASFACGLVTSQRGPSILDLGYVAHTDLQHVASLFAIGAGGHLAGCLVTGVVFEQFQTPMFLFWSLLGLCAFTAGLPWCDSYGVMAALYFFSLACVGFVETGSYADVARRWGIQGGRVVQLLQLSFVFGGVISPALTYSFLMPVHKVHFYGSTNGALEKIGAVYNASDWNGVTTPRTLSYSDSNSRPIRLDINEANISWLDYNTTRNESFHSDKEGVATSVHIAYGITAGVALIASLPFVVGYLVTQKLTPKKKKSDTLKESASRASILRQPRRSNKLALLLVGVFFLAVTAVEESFHQFLFTFLTQEAHWSGGMAALVTSWFWCGVVLVRLASYFLPDNVPNEISLTLSCVTLPCALAGLLVSVEKASSDGVWASVFFSGMSSSLIFPVAFTWFHYSLDLHGSGAMSAVVMFASSLAGIGNPLLIGLFFSSGSAAAGFPVLLLVEACVALLAFLAIYVQSRRLRAKWRRESTTRRALEKFVSKTMEEGVRGDIEIDIEDDSS